MSRSVWTIHNNRTLVTLDDLTTEEALSILRAEQPGDLQYWFAWRDGMSSWNPVVTVVELDLNAPKLAMVEPPKQLASKAEPPLQLQAPPDEVKALVREDQDGQLAFNFGDTEARDDVNSNFEIYWMSDGDSELEKADLNWTAERRPDKPNEKKANLSVVASEGPSAVTAAVAQTITEKDRRKYPRFDIRFKIVIQNDNVTFRTYSRNASLGGLALEVAIPPILMGQSCLIHVTDTHSRETIKLPGRLVANRDQTRYFSFFRASAESITKLQKWFEIVSAVKQVS